VGEEGKPDIKTQQIRYVCEPAKLEEFVPYRDGWETAERIWVYYKDLPRYISWIKSENGQQLYKSFCDNITQV